MATAQLSQEKYTCWSPHPSSFHSGRRFKPHTQQRPKKGPAQQADSSRRSHLASQSGSEPRAESEPELGLDPQIHAMPNRATGDTVLVHPHQGTPFAWKAPLPPGRGGRSECLAAAWSLNVTTPNHGEGDAPHTISLPCPVTMKEGFAVGWARESVALECHWASGATQ